MPTPAASLVPELSVLKPLDPSLYKSEDEYEIYILSNAQVVYENGRPGRHASLLEAYADTPLRVEGRLDSVERAQTKYLVKKPLRPTDIVIREVTRFSYGQTEDGETVIWALGAAGWYELRPGRAYKDIYDGMVQAVEILYFVTDIYNEPRKKGGRPSAQLIWQEYAEDERFACNTTEEARRIFHKHRAFLIMCFLNKAQGIGWSNTPLCQYYKRVYSKEFEQVKARIEGKAQEKEKKSSRAASPPARTGRRSKTETNAPQPPKKDDNWWAAAALFEFMQKAVNLGAIRVGQINLERVARLIVKRYEVEDVELARNILFAYASNLRYMMDHPKRKSIEYFQDEPIYQELAAANRLSAADLRRAQSTELRTRRDHSSLKEDLESDSSGSEEIETPKRPPRHKKVGRLSVLRPKTTRIAGKGKGVNQGKGKAPSANMASASEGEEVAAGSDSDMPIDTPTHALSPGKRKHVPEAAETNPRKRALTASPEPDELEQDEVEEEQETEETEEDFPSSPSENQDEEETESAEPLPLQWRTRNAPVKSPPILPPVISTPLPTYTPNGPGDSWICNFDGCSQKVYGASTDLGRSLITDHLKDHARGRQKEVEIVRGEERRLGLPVNNLIKRIREMAEMQQPLFPSMAGPSAPRPIGRMV
ncbi:uncharacterized protein EI97DRAFT_409689 [Westerdykella ornata]|uniref:DNA (cytosine-5)-methyltransferase 1 replication foci domain-containing protein n=1 Tax=Westerdykella ornata TaxID=318751 RepID=A0A6A6JZ75_WESOR|nr:uncharacterized protein EI97DRAFT_409689 [Westerdykella ornata]KAF2281148.1 hypothetical protein EI97DRAFT_409689 [Westerdykella ornata]